MLKTSSVSFSWRCFAATDIPEGLLDGSGPIGERLSLPDGRVLSSVPVSFPEAGSIDFNEQIPFALPLLSRIILVGDCEVGAETEVLLGISVDWKWAVFSNGQLLCDARQCGNGEDTFEPDDHLVRCHLAPGRNQIACELYNGRSFRVAINVFDDVTPRLKWRPLAHRADAAQNAVTITFATDEKSPAGVAWRYKGESEWQETYDTLGGQIRRDANIHNIRLTGLKPSTQYEYQVFYLDEPSGWGRRDLGEIEEFRTISGPGVEFSFVATADAQNLEVRREWMDSFFKRDYVRNADFFTYIGDIVWTSDFERAVMKDFIGLFQDATGNRKMLELVRGNHEYYGKDVQQFFRYFSMPYPGQDGYGMFRCGDVCFIVLDFGDDCARCPYPSTRALHCIDGYLEEQAAWLDRMVDAPVCRDAKFRIVLAHGLPYGDYRPYLPTNVHKVIDPFFLGENPRCRIHLWMGGHVHYALRTYPGKADIRSAIPLDVRFNSVPKPDRGDNSRSFFTVVACGGPLGLASQEFQMSDFEVQVKRDAILLISHDRYGREYDRISIAPDGTVTELYSSDDFKLNHIE